MRVGKDVSLEYKEGEDFLYSSGLDGDGSTTFAFGIIALIGLLVEEHSSGISSLSRLLSEFSKFSLRVLFSFLTFLEAFLASKSLFSIINKCFLCTTYY